MNSTDFNLVRELEIKIAQRLGRNVLLDHISITEIEQLWYIANHGSDHELSQALNATC